MNGNFTHKAQEAILQAQNAAQERSQQQIDALHLLYALLSQEGSVVLNLLQRLGADIDGLIKKTKVALDKIPVIATPQVFGQLYLTQDMAKVFWHLGFPRLFIQTSDAMLTKSFKPLSDSVTG